MKRIIASNTFRKIKEPTIDTMCSLFFTQNLSLTQLCFKLASFFSTWNGVEVKWLLSSVNKVPKCVTVIWICVTHDTQTTASGTLKKHCSSHKIDYWDIDFVTWHGISPFTPINNNCLQFQLKNNENNEKLECSK